MNFRNSDTIGHPFRNTFFQNPILPSKLVYLEANEGMTQTLRGLKLDLEIYNEQLNREFVPRLKDELRTKIKSTEEEIRNLETAQMPNGNLLLSGLKNNIDEIGILLDQEPDIKKRETLKKRQLDCMKALAERQKEISHLPELNDALDQIESDERILSRLQQKSFDQVDLDILLNSDMIIFFDTSDRQALETAFNQMLINDNAKSILGKRGQIFEDADSSWMKNQEELESDIRDFQVELGELQLKLSEAQPPERKKIRSRLLEVNSIIRHLQNEIETGRSDWTHKHRTLLEKKRSDSVLSMVKPDVTNMLRSRIEEARMIRMEQIQAYLVREFQNLEDAYDKHKQNGTFSPETAEAYEAELAEARRILIDEKQNDPRIIRKLAENFEAAHFALEDSATEITDVSNNRRQIEIRVLADHQRLQALTQNLTPDKKTELLELSRKKANTLKSDEPSAILQKELNGEKQLIDPDAEFLAIIDEFSERLENISELSNEELVAIQQDLDVFMKKLNTFDAEIAHRTIEELESAQTNEEIKRTLLENLHEEHVKIIPHHEFEEKYKEFTPEGDMVIEENGNEWMIIIDEAVFNKSPQEVKRQLIHELLHLEFEKHPNTKIQLREALVSQNPEHWKKIRDAFISKENSEGKTAPDGREWQSDGSHDDDILSEIYAMQNELPKNLSQGKKPIDQLNNLLVGSNLANALGDISKKTRGYEKAADNKTRGYSAGSDNSDDDASFTDVTSLSKGEASHHANDLKIGDLRKRIKELKETGYLPMIPGAAELVSVMDDYNEGTDNLNRDLLRDANSSVIATAVQGRIEKVSGDLGELENEIGKAARKAPNTEIGLLRKLWIRTTFMTVEDFVQLGTDVYEFYQRRHKRRVGDHAAKLGEAIFSGTEMGRESTARSQKAEMEEVNEWKNRYENMDAWQLMEELKSISNTFTPNQDQLKAILRILADKGRIDWQNQDLWRALNKIQSAVVFKPNDPLLLHNPILLRQRMHRALGEIYDFDEFTSLERKNEGSYKSEKSNYDTLHSRMQDQLTGRLDELLSQARDGEQVDPTLYESIIEYCIKNGKSYAENVMFHLMAGMAEGILAPDRGLALGDHLNAWPAVDWFTTMSPPMSTADWKEYCQRHFGKSFKKGSISLSDYGDDFKNWFWTTVQNDEKVIQRVKKTANERGWDHDWGRSIAPLGDAREAKKFFSGRSGQEETKITAVSNAYVGAVQWLEENSKNPQAASKENFARMAGWITMAEGMLDGTAYKDASKDINTRADEALNNDIPRESSIGRHAGDNTRAFRQRCTRFLMLIDPQFFSIISGREARSDAVKRELGEAARTHLIQRYPSLAAQMADVEVIDQIYERIDLIITTMFNQMSEAQFQAILSEMALAR